MASSLGPSSRNRRISGLCSPPDDDGIGIEFHDDAMNADGYVHKSRSLSTEA